MQLPRLISAAGYELSGGTKFSIEIKAILINFKSIQNLNEAEKVLIDKFKQVTAHILAQEIFLLAVQLAPSMNRAIS